jgi:bifunctional non-homologous end joining protein LigD
MNARTRLKGSGTWTPEPSFEKPDISVRATTLYYEIVAPIMMPFIHGRLLNLLRCREGRCFFQRSRAHPPAGKEFDSIVHLQPVRQKNGRTEDYLYVESAEEIVACAKVQTVEFHGWGSRAGAMEQPDRLVIDLDPDPELGFGAVRDAARHVRRSFEALGLESFALLSGGKGIHVVVPLIPEASWAEVREFAKAFCAALADYDHGRFTVALRKAQRRGRIFLDFLRNQRTATAILPYSARARDGAPVAAPVGWDELRDIDRSDAFTIAEVELLLERAGSRKLDGWGAADQYLPRLSSAAGHGRRRGNA